MTVSSKHTQMNLVKENLSIYVPSLVELIGENDFPWDNIDKKFNKKLFY
jgi:hypothetical protein